MNQQTDPKLYTQAAEKLARECAELAHDALTTKYGYELQEQARKETAAKLVPILDRAIVAAQVQQREADAKLATLRVCVPDIGEGPEIAARQREYITEEISKTPLSGPGQEALEKLLADAESSTMQNMHDDLQRCLSDGKDPVLLLVMWRDTIACYKREQLNPVDAEGNSE